MTCPHGFGYTCDDCRKDSKRIDREGIKNGNWIYGVTLWRGDNKYALRDSIKTFKNKPAAEKYATKLNDDGNGGQHGYVVRMLTTKQEVKS